MSREQSYREQNYTAVVAFHGHSCPGAALGLRVAEAAIMRLGRHEEGNELVAVTAVADCSADAIQLITGCTLGRKNLQIEDTRIKAFTFRRADGAEVRIRGRRGTAAFRTPEIESLAHAVRGRRATTEEAARLAKMQADRVRRLLTEPEEALLAVEFVAAAAA
jgi:formylmethanofuran dehydrogenase subunit E